MYSREGKSPPPLLPFPPHSVREYEHVALLTGLLVLTFFFPFLRVPPPPPFPFPISSFSFLQLS